MREIYEIRRDTIEDTVAFFLATGRQEVAAGIRFLAKQAAIPLDEERIKEMRLNKILHGTNDLMLPMRGEE